MANVHPYKGYLNTKFHFYAKGTEDISYNIVSLNKEAMRLIHTGIFSPNIPYSVSLKETGAFRVDFSDGTSSEIIVEDGYKFGGSKHKKSFIFDDCPWLFVIMQDRTYFYNKETDESYVEFISPDKISVISQGYAIFENDGQEERTIYSLHEQKPILNISRIVSYNTDILIWQEDSNEGCINLNIYSLNERVIKKTICVSKFIIDTVDNSIIYTYDNLLYKQNLSLPLAETQGVRIYGELATLVYPNIAISIEKCYYGNQMYLIDTRLNKVISRINIEYPIASINAQTFIDVFERINIVKSFDLSQIGCDEACIKTTYLSFNFYPTEWDLYYTIKQHIFEKGKRTKNTYSYKIKSIISKEEFEFENEVRHDSVVIREGSIFFSNYNETLILGKNLRPQYTKGSKIYKHGRNIISVIQEQAYVLNDVVGWKPLNAKNCSFRYFNEFGIIANNDNDTYFDLYGNEVKGNGHHHYCIYYSPFRFLPINNNIVLQNGIILPYIEAISGVSESGQQCLVQSKGEIYLLKIEKNNIIRKRILADIYDTSFYKSVLFSDDGSQIMYRDNTETIVLDLLSNEIDKFDNISYVKDINGIRPQFQKSGSLQPRIVNPITGQLLDSNLLKRYQFISPNELLYADTQLNDYIEYYWSENNKLLSKEEYFKICKMYSYSMLKEGNSEEYKKIMGLRKKLVIDNFKFLNEKYPNIFRNDKTGEKWDEYVLDERNIFGVSRFIDLFITKKGIAIIRCTSDGSAFAKIDLGEPLWYLNYVSFSYDNRYVAIAGRYPNDSGKGGLFLIYDIHQKEVIIKQINSWAVWLTAFNKKNHVASYSSEPITYDVQLSDTDEEEICVNSYERYNFLTFSPNGEYVALSNQGYVSKYDKYGAERQEWGHRPSCDVYISHSYNMAEFVEMYSDLSQKGIEGCSVSKTVASVSFSNDNKRLMMVGNDGVVIIRNLHLEKYAN